MRELPLMQITRWLPIALCALLANACRDVPPSIEAAPTPSIVAPAPPDLARGETLFATHCSACHGVSGDADGIATPLLYPAPRKFSNGRFLLASTVNGVPTDADLVATIARGMPGSAMPAWEWLGPQALHDLAAWVRSLTRDGVRRSLESEALAAGDTADQDELQRRISAAVVPGERVRIPPRVDVNAAILARGKSLFRANCVTCHGDGGTGRGDEVLFNEDGSFSWARDFTAGILKGGSSFEALATRIQVGLPGTAMPVFNMPQSDVAALAVYTSSLIPAESERRRVHRHGTLRVTRIEGGLPLDAHDAPWGRAHELDVVATPLVWHRAAVEGAQLAALHDGASLVIRMRWRDPTRDDADSVEGRARDAAALAFSNDPAPPLFGMGSREKPVNLWHWKAERLIDARGLLDLVRTVPHTWIDPLFGETRLDVGPVYIPAPSGSIAGGVPVEWTSETFAAMRALENDGKVLTCTARYDDGEWSVVFARSLEPRVEREVSLRPGEPVLIALALWDGSGGDRGGCKSISIWQRLVLE